MTSAVFWTGERVEQLRDLVAKGNSAGQIAARLGCSRNAVIGKVLRMRGAAGRLHGGSNGHRKPGSRAAQPSRQRAKTRMLSPVRAQPPNDAGPIDVALPMVAPMPERPAVMPSPRMLPLTDLTASCCRWPIGDPKLEDFGFCGHETNGAVYCAWHAAEATDGRRRPVPGAPYDRHNINRARP